SSLQHQVAVSGRMWQVFEGSWPLSARRIGSGRKTGPRPADDLSHRWPVLDWLNRGWIKGIAARALPSFRLQSVQFGDEGSTVAAWQCPLELLTMTGTGPGTDARAGRTAPLPVPEPAGPRRSGPTLHGARLGMRPVGRVPCP